MKLGTFSNSANYTEVGIIEDKFIIPVKKINENIPNDMIMLMDGWDKYYQEIIKNISNINYKIPLTSINLHAPIKRPPKIFAIGLNYSDHVLETGSEKPKKQLWFSKQANTIVGPDDKIKIPIVSEKVDYEVELIVVIGKKGHHIKIEEVSNYIFGYCIGNDVSVRDWQMQTSQWMLGKSFDTHGPTGPYITTANEIKDPHQLGIRSFVNGELRQNSNTRHLIFNIWDQVVYLSTALTLEVGDIIFTGTPGGVGFSMNPPKFLKDGDVVRCEIDILGKIENKCENVKPNNRS